jgi:LysR family nitrogen assimilation transcriptional regulator
VSLDPRKLSYFLTVVDRGSFTRAASQLEISQSTLSEHISSLEVQLGRALLMRGQRGVSVTEAGRTLYRHAQLIVRQVQQAEQDVRLVSNVASGHVSLGLATYGAPSTLALPILRRVTAQSPGLLLRINDNFAGTLSESILSGRIDLAIIYGAGPIKGARLRSLFVEELVLFAPEDAAIPGPPGSDDVPLAALAGMRLLLPSRIHLLRHVIDAGFARAGLEPDIAAEIDSPAALKDALRAGLGVALLPNSAFAEGAARSRLQVRPIREPRLEATVSLCLPDQLPITSSVRAVEDCILHLVSEALADGRWTGVRPLAAALSPA